ncbi:MAG TPA: PAS domain-containing protein [Nitrososphaerales archaeon]|nr:PAS domain-containing protein [Nitrososphaerales archaeon]
MVGVGHLDWFEQLPCAVTVCDKNYMILYMNDRAAEVSSKEGGKALIGKNLMDCHPPEAQEKLRKVMASGRPNVYTTEKKGARKLVYQCHWMKGRRVGGLVELSFELPRDMPNHVRV